MKISMYELLGLVKDGKAPKKIRFLNHYYIWKENDEDYQKEDGLMLFGNSKINYILNTEVEILEEEKKIPEKLDVIAYEKCIHEVTHKEKQLALEIRETQIAFNEIIDYLKSKGDE